MLVQCQNPSCGEWFDSKSGKAQCCGLKCYKESKDLRAIDQRLKEAFANDKTHTQMLSQ